MVLRFAIGLLRRAEDGAAGRAGAAAAVAALAEHGTMPTKGSFGIETGGATVIPQVLALCLQCLAEADDGAEAMLGAMAGLVTETMDLQKQGLTDVELGALGKALPMLGRTATPPTTLILDHNQFGAEGLRRLFAGWARGTVTVTTLYLSSNQLTAVPAELGQLAGLTVLNLSYNQLTAVPPELGQLARLRTLALGEAQRATMSPASEQLLAGLEAAGCRID